MDHDLYKSINNMELKKGINNVIILPHSIDSNNFIPLMIISSHSHWWKIKSKIQKMKPHFFLIKMEKKYLRIVEYIFIPNKKYYAILELSQRGGTIKSMTK